MLLSPTLLETIATYLPSEGMMMAFLEALPKERRTPALELLATLSHALGLQVLWPTLDMVVLVRLANADSILAQLLSVNPRLCIAPVSARPIVPVVVATPPRTWPTLRHLSLTIATWTMDLAVLANVQQMFVANAACLRSIDVNITALPIPASDGRYATQSTCLAALVNLLVSTPYVTKVALRATFKVPFPETAAMALAQWIDAMPLTSLTMKNMYELSPTQQLWTKPTLVSLALPNTWHRLDNGSSAMSRHLTHLELGLSGPSPMQDVVGMLVQSPLQSLHLCLSNVARDFDMASTQLFLEDDLPRLDQLTTLRLTNVRLTTTHCLTLALLLPRYNHLGLTSNRMGDAGVLALAPFLRHSSQLKTLTLVDQGFGDVGASALATALVHTPRLRTLDLGRNDITASGAMSLSCLFPNLPRLATWRLCNNPLGAKGLVFLLRAWTYVKFPTATLLDARGSIDCDDDRRDCDALLSDLPRHRTCWTAFKPPPVETTETDFVDLDVDAPLGPMLQSLATALAAAAGLSVRCHA
ncbi:hypothetical protein SPRG_04323 [Saprolegnia parasitica CBS 223.65]|uniref:Uncharacterized protein n=1 Tax=Saprolegnia parasitica (strain CBS 223.65) TaxID=695850 RepID=A0A067CI35_SAPPC|nr:hypothetical protein SPRG_04323 [Saprolegnia parasitica CBS 223.65]KDO30409.1 hypothetical protein SPRG_04323 [Saprolegnia parasitica CBS 223.65]|eukprot:XP_012198644.1 hypothetical protein SPRG_04323 [Saprolegnia parasitica CBS 223.65]